VQLAAGARFIGVCERDSSARAGSAFGWRVSPPSAHERRLAAESPAAPYASPAAELGGSTVLAGTRRVAVEHDPGRFEGRRRVRAGQPRAYQLGETQRPARSAFAEIAVPRRLGSATGRVTAAG
jgi:hypothetical protein